MENAVTKENSTETSKHKRTFRCVVVSNRMNKSGVGVYERKVKHPVVGKYIKKSTKLMFHDENNATEIGDEVLIQETKPISARKTFKLLEILNKGKK